MKLVTLFPDAYFVLMMSLIFLIEANLLLESFWGRTDKRSAQEKELQGSHLLG